MSHVAIARKHKKKEVYVVAAAIMRNSNARNNSRLEANVTIALPGSAAVLRVPVRLQGSVFLLDKTASQEKLVQLDGWHEASHPSHWSSDARVEAELCDLMRPSTDSGWGPLSRVLTEYEAGHGHSFTSFIRLSAGTWATYDLPAASARTGVRVRLRARRSEAGGKAPPSVALSLGGGPRVEVLVPSRAWQWHHVSLKLAATSTAPSELTVVASGSSIDIDQLVFVAERG
eukprot:COSAG04_NODE_523_length_13126_cov_19.987570_8_plen_230_part_00